MFVLILYQVILFFNFTEYIIHLFSSLFLYIYIYFFFEKIFDGNEILK